MSKEKELPKEVVEKIKKKHPHILTDEIQDVCSIIAQSHYEPIIDGLKESMVSQSQTESMLHDKLSEKDATIAKIMGLLKETYLNYKRVSIIFHVKHAKKHLSEIENEFWEQFKKENNLPQ